MTEIRISPHALGEELAGALNDVGFGDSKDAPWFIEEFFHRLKRYNYGYIQSFINAEAMTKTLLDYQSLEPKVNK